MKRASFEVETSSGALSPRFLTSSHRVMSSTDHPSIPLERHQSDATNSSMTISLDEMQHAQQEPTASTSTLPSTAKSTRRRTPRYRKYRTLVSHVKSVTCLKYSPCGRYLASAGERVELPVTWNEDKRLTSVPL